MQRRMQVKDATPAIGTGRRCGRGKAEWKRSNAELTGTTPDAGKRQSAELEGGLENGVGIVV